MTIKVDSLIHKLSNKQESYRRKTRLRRNTEIRSDPGGVVEKVVTVKLASKGCGTKKWVTGAASTTGIEYAAVNSGCLALSVNLTKRVSVLQQPFMVFLPHLQEGVGNIDQETALTLPLQ